MADPFMSEIRIMAFTYPPKGWAFCNGQIIGISQNQALFSLLGTTYGGDGVRTFALPNLQGRIPMHRGDRHSQGQTGGETAHTLTLTEVPGQHNHAAMAFGGRPDTPASSNNALAALAGLYRSPNQDPKLTTLAPSMISSGGGGLPHQNMQPYLGINFCIALQGVFPSRD